MDLKFRALRADEVECRIGTVKEDKGVSLLLYKIISYVARKRYYFISRAAEINICPLFSPGFAPGKLCSDPLSIPPTLISN